MGPRALALVTIVFASTSALAAAPDAVRARSLVLEAMIAPSFPLTGTALDAIEVDHDVVRVRLTLSAADHHAIHDTPTADGELVIEAVHEAIVSRLATIDGLHVFHVLARTGDGTYQPLDRFLAPRAPARPKPSGADGAGPGGPPGLGQTQPAGSLSGKTIFLSQSHGWEWTVCCGWSTQRGVTNGIVEDFINAEAVNQYLIQYLHNAGAQVLTARDRDMTTTSTIVDNDGGNGTSDYVEVGPWTTSTATGFANGFAPYGPTTNPFALGTTRILPASPTETGRVTYTPDVPKTGAYWVYASWGASSNRAPDAHFIVNHAGGTTHVHVDQRRDGYTWIPIGQFVFDAGKDPAKGSVALANDSTATGAYVCADAVRLGGGMGDILDNGTTSGKPRWEEAAYYYTHYLGFDSWSYNDVTTRPQWAEWECEPGEDCLFFSWHTNAPNPGTGTSSYIYNGGATPGSAQLQDAIHTEVVKDIRSGWDPGWTDRGKLQANFGELRPLTSMPGVLMELAFHDTPYDAAQLKQPRFRELAARAIYQGMARYYNPGATLLPEPPIEPTVTNQGGGNVRIDWLPAPPDGLDLGGDPATGYRVYVGHDGRSWQDAIAVSGPPYVYAGTPGEVVYFKVSATNAGGESFPTETLAARVSAGTAPVLIVSGFDRIDGAALIPSNDTIGLNYRMQLLRMNSYDYAIAHATAIAAAGIDFDSATNDAVISGRAALPGYAAVDWILGEESTGDATFDATEQSLVSGYLSAGGNLFVSGAEIGWDLVAQGNGQAFFETVLRGAYDGDDAYAGAATPANEADGIWAASSRGSRPSCSTGRTRRSTTSTIPIWWAR
ncbi:MAG: N-acetylmuramoyl-L-alanine amidase [Acidobacteriota bacterium]